MVYTGIGSDHLKFQPMFLKITKSKYRDNVSCSYTSQQSALSQIEDWDAVSASIYPENPFILAEIEISGTVL